ncbi:hypothetical protein ECA727_00662 [Escherichia coli ECA-727]|nr:hypothetical protein ECA727_00662 [Escherichia coli ECA-727]
MVKHHAPHKEAVVTARYGLYITQLIPLAILLFKLSIKIFIFHFAIKITLLNLSI